MERERRDMVPPAYRVAPNMAKFVDFGAKRRPKKSVSGGSEASSPTPAVPTCRANPTPSHRPEHLLRDPTRCFVTPPETARSDSRNRPPNPTGRRPRPHRTTSQPNRGPAAVRAQQTNIVRSIGSTCWASRRTEGAHLTHANPLCTRHASPVGVRQSGPSARAASGGSRQ